MIFCALLWFTHSVSFNLLFWREKYYGQCTLYNHYEKIHNSHVPFSTLLIFQVKYLDQHFVVNKFSENRICGINFNKNHRRKSVSQRKINIFWNYKMIILSLFCMKLLPTVIKCMQIIIKGPTEFGVLFYLVL